MPTQEDINAANVELQIANDNYAQLADRYNKYQELFQTYAKSSPEIQDRAADAMGRALEDFYQIEEKMRVAEDRIAVAQNTVNTINSQITQQPTAVTTTGGQRRRTVTQPERVQQPTIEAPATYQVPQFTREQINPTLSYGVAPQQPAYTPLPEYVPQYQNNTLGGIVGNFAGQSRRDWAQAGNEWRNIVWPRIKSGLNSAGNAWKNVFVDAPSRAADTVTNFVLGTPQRRL